MGSLHFYFTKTCTPQWASAGGIGNIGKSALESIARQPEAANDIRTNMIISAALIEGVCFFAVVVCLLIALNVG